MGFWGLCIFYSNWSLTLVNFQVPDKYGSKHTGSHTNAQANIGGTCKQRIIDRKYMIWQQYDTSKREIYNWITEYQFVTRTNF